MLLFNAARVDWSALRVLSCVDDTWHLWAVACLSCLQSPMPNRREFQKFVKLSMELVEMILCRVPRGLETSYM